MEKINKFILKSPTLLAIVSFLFAFILTLILKKLLGIHNISLEQTFIPIAISLAYFYGYETKEEMPKIYRLKYSIITTLPYLLLGIMVAYLSPKMIKLNASNIMCISIIIKFVLTTLLIFYLSKYISKKGSMYNYQKIKITNQILPIEIKRKTKIIHCIFFVIFALFVISSILDNLHIINLNPSITFSITIIFFITLFVSANYIKKLSNSNAISTNNEKET